MASCTTSHWGNGSSPQIRLSITADTTTDTYVKYKWILYYIATSSASTSTARSYIAKIDGDTVTSGTYSIGGKTGTKTIASGYKTINRTKSSQTISFSCSMAFNLTWSGTYSGTRSASDTFTMGAITSYTVSYNPNGGSGAPSSQTKWYGATLTLSSTKPTRSGWTFMGWGTSSSDTSVNYNAGGSYTANAGDTLYAIWRKTLTVSYNANGGGGQPSSQSAYIYNSTTNKEFTISSTKPTRNGYSFLGWSKTSTSTSSSYSSGGSITISSNTTLYAVWKANTYTITYNANDGSFPSGATTSQNKTHGTDLTIAATEPTRTNYNFLGWSTSSNATSATYETGDVFTTNEATTLYAVWELGWTKPRISNVKISRCDSSGVLLDEGTFAKLSFNWSCDITMSSIIVSCDGKDWDITSYTEGGTSGSVIVILNGETTVDGAFSTEKTYNFVINVSDANGNNTATTKLNATKYLIDFYFGGNGIAFMKPAERDGIDLGMNTILRNTLSILGETTDKNYLSMVQINGNNDTMFGYGSYNNNIGSTYLNGNNIIIRSKNSITLTGDTILNDGLQVKGATGLMNGLTVSGDTLLDGTLNVGDVTTLNKTLNVVGATALQSTLTVEGTTTFNSSVTSNGSIFLKNSYALYGKNTSGTNMNLIYVNSNDNIVIGYGGYASSVGSTNIYSYEDMGLVSGRYISFRCQYGDDYPGHIMEMFREQSGSYRTIFRPYTNGTCYLGTSSYRWNTAFFTNSITASDLKEKNVIDGFDFRVKEFIMGLKPIAYTRNGSEDGGKRIHLGFGAQTLANLINDLKLGNLSMVQACIVNEDGTESIYDGEEIDDSKLSWGINYNELLAPLIKMVQQQQKEIDSLKDQITKLINT